MTVTVVDCFNPLFIVTSQECFENTTFMTLSEHLICKGVTFAISKMQCDFKILLLDEINIKYHKWNPEMRCPWEDFR